MTVTELVPAEAPGVVAVPVVIVDRHRLFARGLQAALEDASFGRVAVVGHGDEAAKLSELVRRHRPQVVILDLGLTDGLATLALARRRHPNLRIAAMVADATATEAAVAALAAGADGVLLRDAEPEAVAAH